MVSETQMRVLKPFFNCMDREANIMKRYERKEGCFGKVVKIRKDGFGMIIELDNGEEAYAYRSGKGVRVTEDSIVLCRVRKQAKIGRRMLVDVIDIVEYVPQSMPMYVA